jgi:hypothetical protein
VAGSRTYGSRAASADATTLFLSLPDFQNDGPGHRLPHPYRVMPTSANGIFALTVASNSAYDIFAASLSVSVTADDFGERGPQPPYWPVPVLFLALVHRLPVDFAALGPGEYFVLFSGCGQRAGGTLHSFSTLLFCSFSLLPFPLPLSSLFRLDNLPFTTLLPPRERW